MAKEGSQSKTQTSDQLEIPNDPTTELGKLEKKNKTNSD